jgi:hypothetical protein
MLFSNDEGTRLGSSIRRVEIEIHDPRFAQIGRLQNELRATLGKPFFYGWALRRHPSKRELETANLFLLHVVAVFEPAGEERGTKYDESTACSCCGAGATQLGALYLDQQKMPKGKDIAKTIAGEVVVSRRVVEFFERHGVTGADLVPVQMSPSSGTGSSEWFQFNVRSATAEIVPPTLVGIDPFDSDSKHEYRCKRGDLLGLNLLSEVSVDVVTREDADIFCSRQFVGLRRGLLRPERLIFINPKVWRTIGSERLKGGEIEIARIVG